MAVGWTTNFNMDVEKILRQTKILLLIFICFDVFFLVSAIINLVLFTPTEAHDGYFGRFERPVFFSIIGFFITSFHCNR